MDRRGSFDDNGKYCIAHPEPVAGRELYLFEGGETALIDKRAVGAAGITHLDSYRATVLLGDIHLGMALAHEEIVDIDLHRGSALSRFTTDSMNPSAEWYDGGSGRSSGNRHK